MLPANRRRTCAVCCLMGALPAAGGSLNEIRGGRCRRWRYDDEHNLKCSGTFSYDSNESQQTALAWRTGTHTHTQVLYLFVLRAEGEVRTLMLIKWGAVPFLLQRRFQWTLPSVNVWRLLQHKKGRPMFSVCSPYVRTTYNNNMVI